MPPKLFCQVGKLRRSPSCPNKTWLIPLIMWAQEFEHLWLPKPGSACVITYPVKTLGLPLGWNLECHQQPSEEMPRVLQKWKCATLDNFLKHPNNIGDDDDEAAVNEKWAQPPAPGVMTMSGSSVPGIPLPAGGPFGGDKNYWRRHHCRHHQFRRQYCHLLVSHCFLVALSHCLQHYFFYFFWGGNQLKLETSNAN